MVSLCGIDEAGRGPVIGPLVMAGVLIDESKLENLRNIGVKDSKLLSPLQRERLYDKIIEIVDGYEITITHADEVDKAVNSETSNLNWLEADKSIQIITKLNPEKAMLDCPSNNIKAYTDYINTKLTTKTKVTCEHGADATYPEVSAASILAKVTRDTLIHEMKKEINIDFGSGYPSDPKTIKFLKENWNRYDFFRKSWSSWKKLAAAKKQKKLGEF
jgi:ribonuclease HII